MIRSNSDTTTTTASPTPVSPFSSDYSVPSEPTSDETPDLGAFTAVLREWNHLQPQPRIAPYAHSESQSSSASHTTTTSSDLREEKSTVWSHRPIANYLSLSDTITNTPTTDLDDQSSETDRDRPRTVDIQDGEPLYENDFYDNVDESDVQLLDVDEQPSLGYLDEALKFIAAERDRWTAQRDAGISATATAAMLSGIEPRRKRRRKRNKTPRAQSTSRTPTVTASVSDDIDVADADDSSSSVDQQQPSPRGSSVPGLFSVSTPATPHKTRGRAHQAKLQHSRSTPQLRTRIRHQEEDDDDDDESATDPAIEFPDSPRVAQLKILGKKLEALFPEDKEYLRTVRYETMISPSVQSGHSDAASPAPDTNGRNVVLGSFVDTRGVPPRKPESSERLIHVFVDHSNILIGLLNYLRRYPRQHPQYRDSSTFNSTQSPATTSNAISRTSPHSFSSYSFTSPNSKLSANSNTYPKPPKHLSHSALSLILERGRPVTRRVLVTSSPLYQPMESAERLGFEVRIFARVPSTGEERERNSNSYARDGNGKDVSERNYIYGGHKRSQSGGSYSFNYGAGNASTGIVPVTGTGTSDLSQRRQRKRAGSMNNNTNNNTSSSSVTTSTNGINNGPSPPFSGAGVGGHGRRKVHSRKISDNNTSTESEQLGGFARNSGHGYSHSLPTSHTSTPPLFSNNGTTLLPSASITSIPQSQLQLHYSQQRNRSQNNVDSSPQRIRYREQGVDELLQLKLHQVLASIDGPPPSGSTIVLATGDGNVGEFNEDGFLGTVRTALRRGWKVELYAWEGGLSGRWKKEFGEGSEWGRNGSSSAATTGAGKRSGMTTKVKMKGKFGKTSNGRSGSSDSDDSGPRFRVIGMEQFGSELVEIYY